MNTFSCLFTHQFDADNKEKYILKETQSKFAESGRL